MNQRSWFRRVIAAGLTLSAVCAGYSSGLAQEAPAPPMAPTAVPPRIGGERPIQIPPAADAEAYYGHAEYIPDAPHLTGPATPLPPPVAACCLGPAPCVPCHVLKDGKGFLYYGTFPRDDDWFNGFDDAYWDYAETAPIGTHLALMWIRCHERHPGPRYRLESLHHQTRKPGR